MRKLAPVLFFLFLLKAACAQKEENKFLPVSPDDFKIMPDGVDSEAGAIILADVGSASFGSGGSYYMLNSAGLTFERTCRIRIIKREGMAAATVRIPFSPDNRGEYVTKIKASTFNLENGKIVETQLDDRSIFTDEVSKGYSQKKFTLPAVKEGSIIQFSYRHVLTSALLFYPWIFQHEYPCLWSEYRATIPDALVYATISYGYQPFYLNTTEPVANHKITDHRWVMKDIPALRAEAYTTSILNYLARLEFQLTRVIIPGNSGGDILGTWATTSKKLMESPDFGNDLDKNNGWLDDDCKKITAGAPTDLDRAQLIFAWVRDHFTCSAHNRVAVETSLKTVFKNRSGNEAEINLLLAAMLRHVNIAADPVILSTRKNGFINSVYPLVTRFNYVVIHIGNDEAKYYLDASEPWLPFGKLPERCYNGYARVVSNTDPSAVVFDPDSVRETKVTMVILNKDKDGLSGHLQTTPGFNEACTARESIRKDGQDEFIKTIRSGCPENITADGFELDSVGKPEEPLEIAYDLHVSLQNQPDVLYFSPLLGQTLKENPFKATNRQYPVEMPSTRDEVYTLSMEIPDGYIVDELPKSEKFLFNEGKGVYEYVLVRNGDNIQLRSRIRLDQADFEPTDYDKLREFYAYIVKKQNETIVFKKKKT